jgi:hypothetical protein
MIQKTVNGESVFTVRLLGDAGLESDRWMRARGTGGDDRDKGKYDGDCAEPYGIERGHR